ncbi:NAD(P)/FAD-dependent oxidoreductase [Telmatospirillum sp. J64-1]|uniref:NAD(P)/FAD-dependent oxidoreductase n=1 Tax=Telmatospirillum sp. J64-1 TaxID=2502183 RepID=UPI00115E6DA1|nr:NAD(P)/FAD-dependent oxidoreductase [Telmatospirillum sp. J64-1]
MTNKDVVIIGAGAAGLMCALTAGKRGRSVILLDHAPKLAEKIRISGGGRCNFTNLDVSPANYLSGNPHFCKSALARFRPRDFLDMVEEHGIEWHERDLGQLFCTHSAQDIIDMLRRETEAAGGRIELDCPVHKIDRAAEGGFVVETGRGTIMAASVVVATGGLSIPKIGASDFGHRIARQFGLGITELRPALVPLTFGQELRAFCAELAGISLDAEVFIGKRRFREALLFTHRGLSGPSILQISSYWRPGQPIHIDLLPGIDPMEEIFLPHRQDKALPTTLLSNALPRRFVQGWWDRHLPPPKPMVQHSNKELAEAARKLKQWEVLPQGTEGWAKAEVTLGGIDTACLSSATMEAKTVPGLYFIGEVVDVTGWLGGYNFQWAWASGHAAGLAC